METLPPTLAYRHLTTLTLSVDFAAVVPIGATPVIDGAGSRVSVTRFAEQSLQGTGRAPAVNIGRNGTGNMTVRNGGLLEVIGGAESSSNSPHITLGVDAASSGTLKIQGSGSLVRILSSSLVPGGGPGEAFNPFMSVGYDGQGALEVTGGGQLLLQGNATSTPTDQRSTTLYIGGRSSDCPGGKGLGLVSGAGSAIRVQGADAFIGVGSGVGANGQLTIRDNGLVEATIMIVGRNAVGVLSMDRGTLNLSGQQTGGSQFGAALSERKKSTSDVGPFCFMRYSTASIASGYAWLAFEEN